MTEQEKQLIEAFLAWDNAKAPEAALILARGLNQNLNTFHKKVLNNSLRRYHNKYGEYNSSQRIDINIFIAFMFEESKVLGVDFTELLSVIAFYHLNPQFFYESRYSDINVPIGGFDPKYAEQRMQEAISVFISGIASGYWQLKEYPEEFRKNKKIVIEVMKIDGLQLEHASDELKSDKEVVLESVRNNFEAFAYASDDLKADKKFTEEVNLLVIDCIFNPIKKELQNDKIYIDLNPLLSFSIDRDTQLFDQAWNILENAMYNDTKALDHYLNHKQFDIKTLLLSIYFIVWLGGNDQLCNRITSLPNKKWSNLFDGLSRLLDVLKLKCEASNENWYEVILEGLSFKKDTNSILKFTDIKLQGIENIGFVSKTGKLIEVQTDENKAFKIFIYRLIQDCFENSIIHESLTINNLLQWTLNAFQEFTYCDIQYDDSSSDIQWILERFIPKEFYENWKFIDELFYFEYEHECGPYIFRLPYKYVLNQIPKIGFNAVTIKNNLQDFSLFLEQFPDFHQFVPQIIFEDRAFLNEHIFSNTSNFKYLPEKLRSDKELVLECLKSPGCDYDCYFLQFVSQGLRSDKAFAIELVKVHFLAINYLSEKLRSDKDVALESFKCGHLLEELEPEITQVLDCIPEELLSDEDFALEIVKIDGTCLEYLPSHIQSNKKVVLAAVREYFEALKYASVSLQNDPELIQLAAELSKNY